MVRNPITPSWLIQLYCIYHLNCVVTGGLHIGQIFFLKVTYLCCKTPFYDYILGSMLLSTSQSVHRWQQCTSRLLPSCPTLPSWPSQDQSVPPPLWCWPAARWGWQGVGCTPWTWAKFGKRKFFLRHPVGENRRKIPFTKIQFKQAHMNAHG